MRKLTVSRRRNLILLARSCQGASGILLLLFGLFLLRAALDFSPSADPRPDVIEAGVIALTDRVLDGVEIGRPDARSDAVDPRAFLLAVLLLGAVAGLALTARELHRRVDRRAVPRDLVSRLMLAPLAALRNPYALFLSPGSVADRADTSTLPPPLSLPEAEALLRRRGAGGASALVVPSVLGHYRVDSTIGRGPVSVVYDACDQRSGRRVVLRTFRPEALSEARAAEFSNRFQREPRTIKDVVHPVFVLPEDLEYDAVGHPYLVVGYVDGVTLDRRRGEAMTFGEAVDYLRQVIEALQALRVQGAVHHFLSARNVVVGVSGLLSILDLGVARPRRSDLVADASPDMPRPFRAPEQTAGRRSDHRADVYSAGALAAWLITGHPPKPVQGADTAAGQLQRSGCPPAVSVEIARCLSSDPARRRRDLDALASTLEYCVARAVDLDRSLPALGR